MKVNLINLAVLQFSKKLKFNNKVPIFFLNNYILLKAKIVIYFLNLPSTKKTILIILITYKM